MLLSKIIMLILVVGILSCSDNPTEIVLNIYTEYNVPEEMDKIELSILRSESVFLSKGYPIISGDELPIKILITQENNVEEIIGIEVTGKKGDATVAKMNTEAVFSKYKRVYLNIYLKRDIYTTDAGGDEAIDIEGTIADGVGEITDFGCTEYGCGPNAMCKNGECLCNIGFDNCNQDWSDGCEVDLFNDPTNCGTCKKTCNPINVERVLCEQGKCDYDECNIMYEDRDGKRENGCEEFNYFPKVYGGVGDEIIEDIRPTSDGGIVLVGTTTSCCFGGKDLWVLKLDRQGNVEWQKVIGGYREEMPPFEVYEYNELYYITGSTSSFGEGNMSALLVILDSEGELVSAKILGSKMSNYVSFSKMLCRGDICIILGNAWLDGLTGADIFELTVNRNLSITGQRAFKIANAQENVSFIEGGDGYIYIAKNRISQTESSSTIFMINKNMDISSAKELYGDIGITLTKCVQISSDGVYCSGYSDPSNPDKQQIVLIKYSYANKGSIVWQKAYGTSENDYGSISEHSSISGLLIGGRVAVMNGVFNTLFMNLDMSGNPRFIRAYSGPVSEGGMYMIKYVDNLFLIGGISTSYAYGGTDIFVMPVDMNGIVISECHLKIERDLNLSFKDLHLNIRDVNIEEIFMTDFSFEDIDIGIKDMQDFKAGSICEK